MRASQLYLKAPIKVRVSDMCDLAVQKMHSKRYSGVLIYDWESEALFPAGPFDATHVSNKYPELANKPRAFAQLEFSSNGPTPGT